MEFDHIGLLSEQVKADETFVPATRVWVTNPQKHPFKVEWLRYETDRPTTNLVKTEPHVAFRVDSLQEASKGLKVILEPFDVDFAIVGFYQCDDGAVIELMEFKPGRDWPK